MKLKVKPCKYCNEHAIEMSRCTDINPMEPVRMLCTKCNFQIYGATEKEAIERWNKEYDLAHKPKGVMIVGIAMPKGCCECPIFNRELFACNIPTVPYDDNVSFCIRNKNCPLQEVK